MSVFHVGKRAAVSVFVRFPTAFSVCVDPNQLGYLAFRTTKVKDKTNTKNYSILSRMKQLFNFFSVTNIRQKSCRVSVPATIYNSLIMVNGNLGVIFSLCTMFIKPGK